MMPSSSWNRFSISVSRMRADCCSRRIRSRSFLPCSSAMHGLCCHCWIRWGRISQIRLARQEDRHFQGLSNLLHTTLYSCKAFPGLLGSELHAAVIRAVFGVGACSFDTSGSETLSGSSAVPNLCPLTVFHPVAVLLFGFVLPRLILLFLMNENKVLIQFPF